MRVMVDALGDACPIPVVKTKNAIKEMKENGSVETLVDNEIAVQNLTKMAKQKGYAVHSEKLEEGKYQVVMEITVDDTAEDTASTMAEETSVACYPDQRKKNTVVVLSSSTMGEGDDELGTILMKGFVYAISQQDELPSTILLYNGGATLTCQDAPTLADFKRMEAQGLEILTCGTCLNHYGLADQLKVGSVTNMYVIAEKMSQATLIIKP